MFASLDVESECFAKVTATVALIVDIVGKH